MAKKNQSETQKKCKHCGYPSTCGYSLWESQDKFIQSFQLVRSLKSSELVECPNCKQIWILTKYGENKEVADLEPVTETERELVEFWGTKKLTATKEQLKVLKKIGGINGDAYGNGRHFIEVPCKVQFEDGTHKDFCVVMFCQKLPYIADYKQAKWITDVRKIEVSKEAMPYKTRFKTSLAPEIHYGYTPTLIQDPDGKVFEVGGITHFFRSKKHSGATFQPYFEPHQSISDIPQERIGENGTNFYEELTYIYAEWTEGLEKILLKEV